MVSIAKTCPGTDTLCHTPAGTIICSVLHRNLGCCHPFRMLLCNQIARIQAQHMRDMPVPVALSDIVSICVLIKLFLCIPLFNLTALSDFNRRQTALRRFPLGNLIFIYT